MNRIRDLKVALAASMVLMMLASCSHSPTGRRQVLLMDPAQIDAMGVQSFDELKQKEKISDDKALNAYVQCVSDSIIAAIPSAYGYDGVAWEVVVFDSEQVNAFALPGAKIGVYTGLLKVATEPDELAAVIGHEVSHVLAQHSNERLSANTMTQMGVLAAGVAIGASDTDHKGAKIAALSAATTVLVILPYSRSHETEADVLGQDLMANAGFDPEAAVRLWQKMGEQQEARPPEFLSTHPAPETRVNQLQQGVFHLEPTYLAAIKAGRKPNCKAVKV